MMEVRKAVIPVAGMGTRFLPVTKTIPKEMLPIVDKPAIQYVVEEAVQSGMGNIIFITGRNKAVIDDYFDRDLNLENQLKEKRKEDLLEIVRKIGDMIIVSSIRQKQPLGLGNAVSVAEAMVGEEPFGVFLSDDIITHPVSCMEQLLLAHRAVKSSVVAVRKVPWENVSRYGVVSVDPVQGKERLFRVNDLVEKPSQESAPSNLAVIGRYVLTPPIFDALRRTQPGVGGEIQLTDGLRHLLEDEPLYAYKFEGTHYDTGNKLDRLIATVEFALQRKDLQEKFREYLKSLKL